MTKNTIISITFMALLAAASMAYAAPTTIDFEDLTTGDVIGSHYAGLTFSSGAQCFRVPDYNYQNYPPHSGQSVVADVGSGSIRVDFDTEASMVGAWFMTNGITTVYLEAYDAGGNLIGTTSVNTPPETTVYAQVAAANIKYVIIHDTANYWGMDDFTYECGQQTAPEFGSIAAALAVLLTAPAFAYLAVKRRE